MSNPLQAKWLLALLVIFSLAISACAPMPTPAANAPAAEAADSDATPEMAETGAMATVTTRSLRVRAEPADAGTVIAGIKEGERYGVLGISSDGGWVQLAIADAPGGNGWVNANFVSVEGSISDATTVQTPASNTPTTTTVPGPASPAVQPLAGYGIVATEGTRLRVRSEPSADGPIVGFIYDGEQYQILETSADGEWVKIPPSDKNPSDNTEGGWVAAQYLVIEQ